MTIVVQSDALRLPRLDAHPATPPADFCLIYILDSDGLIYIKDESGTETVVGSGGGGGGAEAFLDLTDVPASYSGQALKVVRVNAGASALEFVTPADADTAAVRTNVNSQYSAASVKSSPTGGDFLLIEDQADSGAKKVIQIGNLPGSAATFNALTDTPGSYSGEGNKFVRVKSTEDGLEFATVSPGSGAENFTELLDAPASYSGQSGKYVRVNGTADGLEFGTPSGGGGGGAANPIWMSLVGSTSVEETTAESTIVGTTMGEFEFPSDLEVGDMIRVTLWGITFTGDTPYEFSFKLYCGPTQIALTNGRTTNPTDVSGWRAQFELVVRDVGASGNVTAFAVFNNNDIFVGATGVDFTDDRTIDATVTMSDDSTGNKIETHGLVVEVLRVIAT